MPQIHMNSLSLIIHNVGFIFSILLLIFFIILGFAKDHKKLPNRLFLLSMTSILVFVTSHVIGVNIADPHISRFVLMFNISNIYISCFLAHFIFVYLGKAKEQRGAVIAIYTVSILMTLMYIIFPDTFLYDSVPKLYFPNYYVAGSLQWVMRLVSNIIIPTYFLIFMFREYFRCDTVMKNRLKYLFLGTLLGYAVGSLAIPLVFTSHPVVFGVLIDPVYSIFFVPFFVIPFTYAFLKYELLDIRIVAKRAFVYAVAVAVIGLLIVLLNFSNNIIEVTYPNFPSWIIPFISAIIAVSIAFMVWNKLRESDLLKYEFITVVTHKFRTPLTQIRWAVETLGSDVSDSGQLSINQIKNANYRLIELTNLLVRLSDTDSNDYEYQPRPFDLTQSIVDAVPEYAERAHLKNITLFFDAKTPAAVIAGDETKTKFALQILLDNAINYNQEGGKITVVLTQDQNAKERSVTLSVTDTGIGLSKEESGRLFQKFWRSSDALKADTEGMGIGLFMARRIVEREGGKLWAESEGTGKGSTFHLRMPLA